MKTNLNKFLSWNQKHFDRIKSKFRKEQQLKNLLNTELLSCNFEKHEHSKRIDRIKLDTTFNEWSIK